MSSAQKLTAPLFAVDAPRNQSSPHRLRTRDGACAALIEKDGAEVVAVQDRHGRLIFEYDPQSGRGSLIMPEGDLALHAARGGIDLVAAEGIRCVSGGDLVFRSRSGASIGVGGSVIGADERGVALRGENLRVDAEQANLSMNRARYRGEQLDAQVSWVRLTMDKLESAAERVVARATNVFQRVQGLHQLKAGRLRTLVRDTISCKGRDVTVKAQEDVCVDGERINLG